MYVCMYECMHACVYVYTYVCMHACMNECALYMLTHINNIYMHQRRRNKKLFEAAGIG